MASIEVCLCVSGYASESEGEELGGEGDVTLPQDLPGTGNVKAGQSAVRLVEVNYNGVVFMGSCVNCCYGNSLGPE